MGLERKLAILADAAKYDASCASSGVRGRKAEQGGVGSVEGMGICHSFTPDGRCVSLLKLLLTNWCQYDCLYCVNRRSSGVARARFTVEEVVRLTLDFYRRNYVEGLFLSSGIARSSDDTMEQLVRVARTLREAHDFQGYIHLKTIPHASPELIAEAGRWADRLSINVELPTGRALRQLAPEKDHRTIRRAMAAIDARIGEARAERGRATMRGRVTPPAFAPAGQSTQLIVGATPESDATILHAATTLYRAHRLRRVYYSAFSPIPDAPGVLPSVAPPLVREHRLYQADWLVRFYGFEPGELTTPEHPDLDLALDPKSAWALRHRERFPVDVNRAPREALLRVPGMGTRSVARLLEVRRRHRVRLADLAALGVALRRALPFVATADHNLGLRALDGGGLRAQLIGRRAQMELFGGAMDGVGAAVARGAARAAAGAGAALAAVRAPTPRSVVLGEL